MADGHGIVTRDADPAIAHSAVAHIEASSLDHGSRELHPMTARLKIHLVGMQFKMQPLGEETAQQRHRAFQPVAVVTYQDEIINITAIVFEAQAFGHILVETVHIEVGEQL